MTRTTRIVLTVATAAIVLMMLAQSRAESNTLDADTRAAIEAAALDYIDGWYTADPERMRSTLHPQLSKRRVRVDDQSRSWLDHMNADRLINGTARRVGNPSPEAERFRKIDILDVYGDTASVRVEMRDWVDYMHLAKFNDRWLIINVLWESKPRQP